MQGKIPMDYLDALSRWAARHTRLLTRTGVVAGTIVAAALAVFYIAPMLLVPFAPKLDTTKDLYAVNRPVAFTFLDASGEDVGHRGAIIGERLHLGDMPAYLPAAFIAMEDRRFYSHNGIDMRGLLRATLKNFHAGHVVAGGSTITQQTAKIVFLNSKRTYRASSQNCWTRRRSKNRSARRKFSNSISIVSISVPAPMAWTARPMSISANRRGI